LLQQSSPVRLVLCSQRPDFWRALVQLPLQNLLVAFKVPGGYAGAVHDGGPALAAPVAGKGIGREHVTAAPHTQHEHAIFAEVLGVNVELLGQQGVG